MSGAHSIKNLEIKHWKLKKGYVCNQAVYLTPEKVAKSLKGVTCKNCLSKMNVVSVKTKVLKVVPVAVLSRERKIKGVVLVAKKHFVESQCPKGHNKIDYVNLGHRDYCFCYVCKKKYYRCDFVNDDLS